MASGLTFKLSYNRELDVAYLNGEKLIRSSGKDESRKIFINGDYIVKIEDKSSYHSQCQAEFRLWNKIQNRDRKYFVPILYFTRRKEWSAVIQPFLRIKKYNSERTSNKYYKMGIERMERKYNIDDLCNWCGCNWGVVNGHPVIYDYGL